VARLGFVAKPLDQDFNNMTQFLG